MLNHQSHVSKTSQCEGAAGLKNRNVGRCIGLLSQRNCNVGLDLDFLANI